MVFSHFSFGWCATDQPNQDNRTDHFYKAYNWCVRTEFLLNIVGIIFCGKKVHQFHNHPIGQQAECYCNYHGGQEAQQILSNPSAQLFRWA